MTESTFVVNPMSGALMSMEFIPSSFIEFHRFFCGRVAGAAESRL